MVEHCPSGALVYEIGGEIVEPDIPRAVSPVEDGPLWVTGNVSIVRSDGTPLETRNRVTLCRCGESKNKPMCDGTHADVGFVAKSPVAQFIGDSLPKATEAGAAPGITSRIVLGVCESTAAETYGVAAMIARAGSSNVSVVHAGRRGPDSDRVVSNALGLVEKAGVSRDRLDSEVRTGSPPAALAEAAGDVDAGLMIVGRGSDRLARIPLQILLRAPCDVLVAARGIDRPERYRHILVATDGSATADRAAKRGFGLAQTLGAEVHLVFIGHPATGRLILADTIEVYGRGVTTRSRLLRGSPLKRILGTAAAIGADLVVVGNKGMTKSRMLLKTSVPGGVLKGARCDVLLCRTVRQLESELEPGDGGVIERNGEELAAFVDERGELHLMSARCPHLGCVVAWNPTDSTFDCPCHGSTFGPLGEVLDGPASKPLRPV
jgi:nucleotide-binding universal stress UspA family protein/CDGSH-type Zn-finger protein/nitrite reductase/ring-hydroxylating ferredoxin subunit